MRNIFRYPFACFLLLINASVYGEYPARQKKILLISGETQGNDSVASLRLAIQRQAETGLPTRIVLKGRFVIDQPLRLTADNNYIEIEATKDNPAELVASNGVKQGVVVTGSVNARIAGLRIRGFAQDGILVTNARGVIIDDNVVQETFSKAWSQGAIHLTGTVTGAMIRRNLVTGADYAGILVDTDATADISGVQITSNHVHETCRRVHDCGAIYVNDRGRRSRGILIANNEVSDFGPVAVGGRGIYVDDWASHVTVLNNRIAGPGQFAFQIHGGNYNRIERNSVDMTKIAIPLMYQAAIDGTRASMTNNIVSNNIFVRSRNGSPVVVPAYDRTGEGAVKFSRNQQCVGRDCSFIR